jgi:hypothetical protein
MQKAYTNPATSYVLPFRNTKRKSDEVLYVFFSLCSCLRLTASPRYARDDVRFGQPERLCYLVYSLSELNAAESLDASSANSCGGGSP